MYVVYLLRCADGTLYTGSTNHLPRRLDAHGAGKGAKYTRTRRPVELVYWEEASDRSHALRREWTIKQLTRAQKLALVAEHPLRPPELALGPYSAPSSDCSRLEGSPV